MLLREKKKSLLWHTVEMITLLPEQLTPVSSHPDHPPLPERCNPPLLMPEWLPRILTPTASLLHALPGRSSHVHKGCDPGLCQCQRSQRSWWWVCPGCLLWFWSYFPCWPGHRWFQLLLLCWVCCCCSLLVISTSLLHSVGKFTNTHILITHKSDSHLNSNCNCSQIIVTRWNNNNNNVLFSVPFLLQSTRPKCVHCCQSYFLKYVLLYCAITVIWN